MTASSSLPSPAATPKVVGTAIRTGLTLAIVGNGGEEEDEEAHLHLHLPVDGRCDDGEHRETGRHVGGGAAGGVRQVRRVGRGAGGGAAGAGCRGLCSRASDVAARAA